MSASATNELISLAAAIVPEADISIAAWHQQMPALPASNPTSPAELITSNLYFNFQLWHVEDEARRTDVPDSTIAEIKRSIDKLNQLRNDAIEAIDTALSPTIRLASGYSDNSRYNSETAGSIIDRLHILSLKIYHMNEQVHRSNTDEKHRTQSAEKHAALLLQRATLGTCLAELIDDYLCGNRSLHRFRQFKMYNNPSLNPALYRSDR